MREYTQRYLGMQDAVVLCVDHYDTELEGRLYHRYQREAEIITDKVDILETMEELFNRLNFPFPGNNERHFIETEKTVESVSQERVMKDEELLEKHGDLGTFIIRVQHRQNSSWQGRITWVEEDKTLSFRSVWEMMKLIDEAMEKSAGPEEEKTPGWDE